MKQAAVTAPQQSSRGHGLHELGSQPMVEGSGLVDDSRAAWTERDFKTSRLEIVFLDQHQTLTEDGTITFCQGSAIRLLLLVYRPDGHAATQEKFQRDWASNTQDMTTEIRISLADESRSLQSPELRPRPERMVVSKGCNLTRVTTDTPTGEGLSPEERARAEDAQADMCYLLESDIEVKQRHVDRPLQFTLQLTLQDRSHQAGGRQRGFETRAGPNIESIMSELVALSFTAPGQAKSRVLTRSIKIVDPISILSTYACHNDGSYINIQVENRHPVLDLVIQDVGFHLTHSVKGTDKVITAPPLVYARMDRTTSYKGTAGALQAGEEPGELPLPPRPAARPVSSRDPPSVFSPIALPTYLSGITEGQKAPQGGPLSPRRSSNEPTNQAPAAPAQQPPDGLTPSTPVQEVDGTVTPSPSGLPAEPMGPMDMLTPTNRGQNTFISLTSLFRIFWVERVTLPLVIQPGFRHGLVFRVESYASRPEAPELLRHLNNTHEYEPLHGPFWTPLTVAWVVRSAQGRSEAGPPAQSPVFFTDKMIVWDAAAPVNQDLSVSIDVEPSVQLNEIFTVTLTVVNLTGAPVDLILKTDSASADGPGVGRSSSSKASFNVSYDNMSGRRTPRSAHRLKTFMALRRLASSELSASEPPSSHPTPPSALTRGLDGDEDEEDEGEEDSGEESEEGEDSRKRYEEVGARGARRERCSDANLVVLDTAMPVGLLNHLDERTIQIQLLAVRAGLCRLSNLVFEERNAKVAYRLTRPLEIFVRQPDSKVIGGQYGQPLPQDHQGPASFFASPSPS